MKSYVLNVSERQLEKINKELIIQPTDWQTFDNWKNDNRHKKTASAARKYLEMNIGDMVYIKYNNDIIQRAKVWSNINEKEKSYKIDFWEKPRWKIFQRDPELIARTKKKTSRGLWFCEPAKYLKEWENSFEKTPDNMDEFVIWLMSEEGGNLLKASAIMYRNAIEKVLSILNIPIEEINSIDCRKKIGLFENDLREGKYDKEEWRKMTYFDSSTGGKRGAGVWITALNKYFLSIALPELGNDVSMNENISGRYVGYDGLLKGMQTGLNTEKMAKGWLEKQGWNTCEGASGYDIKGEKNGEEIHFEVKSSTFFRITQNELKASKKDKQWRLLIPVGNEFRIFEEKEIQIVGEPYKVYNGKVN